MKQHAEHLAARDGGRGSILLLVVMLMAAVAMMSLALVSMLRSFHGEQESSRESLSAQYVCEAGLGEAFVRLRLGEDANLGSEQAPVAYGDAGYWVVATDLGDQRTSLLATGFDDRASASIEMIVEQQGGGFFQWGAFGDTQLHLDSNARVDSYDSSEGTYASQVTGNGNSAHGKENGNVGSNGPITTDSNVKVWGDATPGMLSSVTKKGNSIITGATTPRATPQILPPVLAPVGLGANATINGTQSRPAGTHFFNNLTLNSNAVLNVAGPATLVVQNLSVGSNSQLRVDSSNGPVTIYVARNFTLNSNAQIRSLTRIPADVSLVLSSTVLNTVSFDSNTELYGTVYAPLANITINSNAQIFGSIVAWRLELNSNSRVHYDEALARQNAGAEPDFELLCWRMVQR